jgi:hypothetical protein
MSLSKMTVLAAGLALAFTTFGASTAVKAQAPQNAPSNMLTDVGEDEAVYVNPKTGKVSKAKTKVSAAHHTKAMAKGGREISGAMIYRKGGKLYLLENKPTTGGKTMMHEDFQDMFDVNQY